MIHSSFSSALDFCSFAYLCFYSSWVRWSHAPTFLDLVGESDDPLLLFLRSRLLLLRLSLLLLLLSRLLRRSPRLRLRFVRFLLLLRLLFFSLLLLRLLSL